MGMEVRDWIGVDGQLDVKDRMEMCVDGGEIGWMRKSPWIRVWMWERKERGGKRKEKVRMDDGKLCDEKEGKISNIVLERKADE